jgi:ActR/RegA family two-component response regulator
VLITLRSVNFAEQSLEQFPVAYAVWRVSDQVIVYANKHAFEAFGAGPELIGSTTLWDIIGPLDTNIILSESIRSSPHGGPDLHLPDEAFATFKRQDTGEMFSGWYRAKDIVDTDGEVRHRAALVFTNYDVNLDQYHYQSFIDAKAQVIERELAARVAHDINNSLAILETEIESLAVVHGLHLKEALSSSFQRLRNIGLDMRRLASISESLLAANSDEVHAQPIPDHSKHRERPSQLLRILVVDDEPELAAGLSTILELKGFWTQIAQSKKEALAKSELFKPHAALIDIRLGNEDGTDVACALREMFPKINIVYMTGYSSLLPAITASSSDPVLKKPFEISNAIAALTKDMSNANNN